MKVIINQHTQDPLKFLVTIKYGWVARNVLQLKDSSAIVKKTGNMGICGTTEYITSDGYAVGSYIADEIDRFIKSKEW